MEYYKFICIFVINILYNTIMRLILTLILILTSLYSSAGGLDSTSMFNKSTEREINLHIRSYDKELSTNGLLVNVSGLGFITAGVLLDKRRIERNLPDGYFGYSKSKDISLNYGLISLGAGLIVTGTIMIRKAYKK